MPGAPCAPRPVSDAISERPGPGAISDRGHQRNCPGRRPSDPCRKRRLRRGQPTRSLLRSDPPSSRERPPAVSLRQLLHEGVERQPRLLPDISGACPRLVRESLPRGRHHVHRDAPRHRTPDLPPLPHVRPTPGQDPVHISLQPHV